MKFIALFFISITAYTQVYYQKGYYREDGTKVRGHYKTKPNNNLYDNLNRPTQKQIREKAFRRYQPKRQINKGFTQW